MVKKYLIRVIGALCILGALALMFLPSWVKLDGVDRGDLRDARKDIVGIFDAALEDFNRYNAYNEDFTDELKDYDLPASRAAIKSRFKEITKLTDELLNDTISLQELLVLSTKTPGIMTDAENLLDSDCSGAFFYSVANYILAEQEWETGEVYEYEAIEYAAEHFEAQMADGIDEASSFTFIFTLLAVVLILILVLGVAAAATHICNKGRWVKYLFLVVLVTLVAGSCIAFPMVSGMLADTLESLPMFEDLELQITVYPFIAVALTITPIVLDIIFERKKRNTFVEVRN